MSKTLIALLIFATSGGLVAQTTPTKSVVKTVSGNALTEDLTAGSGRVLQISSGGTLTYSTGALFGGNAGEFRTDIGLGSVENTALSTWAGSTNVTTLGTVATGTWQGSAIANAYLANHSMTIGGTVVDLGGTLTTSAILDSVSSTRGTVLYRGASGWSALTPGTSGYFLKTNGAGADPAWAAVPGGGDALTTNSLAQFAATSSSELRGVMSDESGTGALIFAGGALGAATATSINGLTISTSTGTLTVANGKTLTASNTLTLAGTDGSTLNIGAGGTLGTAAYEAATSFQPVDPDLTSIAALSTDAYGRSLLTLTNAAGLRSTAGLGNVENTALSTWAGSTNVTTLGTVATGTWQGSAIANTYLANHAMTIGGTSVDLGGTLSTSAILDSVSSTRGTILYRGASGWAALSPGTSGHFLKTNGAGADPAWAEASGGGGGGKVAQVVVTTSGTVADTNAVIPIDGTPPTDSEGTAFASLDTSFTPTNASSTLIIEVELMIGAGATSECMAALYEDGTTNALRAALMTVSSQWTEVMRFRHVVSAGSTSSRTYKIRFGVQSGGGMFINSNYAVYTNRLFGTAGISSLTVTEILP